MRNMGRTPALTNRSEASSSTIVRNRSSRVQCSGLDGRSVTQGRPSPRRPRAVAVVWSAQPAEAELEVRRAVGVLQSGVRLHDVRLDERVQGLVERLHPLLRARLHGVPDALDVALLDELADPGARQQQLEGQDGPLLV